MPCFFEPGTEGRHFGQKLPLSDHLTLFKSIFVIGAQPRCLGTDRRQTLTGRVRLGQGREQVPPLTRERVQPACRGRVERVCARAHCRAQELVKPLDCILNGHVPRDVRDRLLEGYAKARALADRQKRILVDATHLPKVVKTDSEQVLAEFYLIAPPYDFVRNVSAAFVGDSNGV